jgi:hypothetical protein
MRPLNKVRTEWSPEFAYAIGLLATDGCLYNDGRYINFTSNDKEPIDNFLHCLKIERHIGKKWNGAHTQECYVVQFGDADFYKFLLSIGITPHKSKTLGEISIPDEYFFDFLRGHYDGDGTFYSYWDPRWQSSFMFYTVFSSASASHIDWIRKQVLKRLGIRGHATRTGRTPMYAAKYAKSDSLQLLPKLYYNREVVCLSRKREKIKKALALEGKDLYT